MTTEEKQLLYRDLCARSCYEVIVKTPYNDARCTGLIKRKSNNEIDYIDVITDKQVYPIKYIKPYLRPMSSMTEEESHIFDDLLLDTQVSEIYFPHYEDMVKVVDWLNEHCFDFRGLIEKGIALPALDGMYDD